jgi:hypothetical protein
VSGGESSIRLSSDDSEIRLSSVAGDLKVNLARRREDARSRISFVIVGSLGAIVACSFVSVWLAWFTGHDVADVEKIIQVLLSPVVGIVGAVTGFYFGEKQAETQRRADDS